jgi:integrase
MADPRRGEISLSVWAAAWVKTRHDLRPSTWARLETTLRSQVLPQFGDLAISKINNAAIRSWVAQMLDTGLSPATARKAVFALRQCLGAAVEDNRIRSNPALAVPLPSERQKPPRFLSQREVERLVLEMPGPYKALVLLGAYAGLRWGEAVGLTRSDVDVLRSRVTGRPPLLRSTEQ